MKRTCAVAFHYLLAILVTTISTAVAADRLDFNRDIRPILSDKCFACHGPDAGRVEGGLRLDKRESAIDHATREPAIVPGDPSKSELVRRINSDDADERMPPKESHKTLSEKERALLARWIEQGAEYKPHWAYIPPQRPKTPEVQGESFRVRNPIDAFIADRLQRDGLTMSPEADRATLIRRVSLDLTGLPPTPAEVDAFLADKSDAAYERVVDRLLASPRYAERMAMQWLDLARYADTHGYNNDATRTQWPWRDWVIHAFDTNLPYDQFIRDQLAGDLLENATPLQRLATAFGRNHVMTSEGGIIQEEYRVEYVADRVHTTATAFLGMSMQCARCHDHKFDPISQRDYYQFFAFFNNLPEKALEGNSQVAAAPVMQTPSPLQLDGLTQMDQQIAALQKQRDARLTQIEEPLADWEQSQKTNAPAPKELSNDLLALLSLDETEGAKIHEARDPQRIGSILGNPKWIPGKIGQSLNFDGQTHGDLGQLFELEHNRPFSIGAWIYPTSADPITVISKMDDAQAYRGFDLIIEQGKPAVHLIHHFPNNYIKVKAEKPVTLNAWHYIVVAYDGTSRAAGVTIYVDGVVTPLQTVGDSLSDTIVTEKPVHLGKRSASVPFHGQIDEVRIYSRPISAVDAVRLQAIQGDERLAAMLAVDRKQRTPEQQDALRRYYVENVDSVSRTLGEKLTSLNTQRAEFAKALPQVMVMSEMPTPRQATILNRGEYDQPGEPVSANVPASLPPLPKGAPANRLGLAQWLVDPSNPLTARVTVNRWWQTYFGIGIVETVEDFGSQSAWPSHPELLDWLATELIDSGWNVKAMQKQIVMSAAYRQSSRVTPELLERDPKNQLLARGPRYRLPAETVRDNALAVSGLLVERFGGPSVFPYQPDGLWEEVSVDRRDKYKKEQGENLYRRSMYTFWKRTCPPPAMSVFDAPDRETCLSRRARTNTPLQALVLMNDPTYIEASRKLAERALREGGATETSQLDHAFRLVLARSPRPDEQQTLLALLGEATERFRATPTKAAELLKVGDSKPDASIDPPKLAGWTVVSSLLLSLDEAICKQ